MRTRSAAIDAVRVVGLVAIVAGHTWTTRSVHAVLYPWHVAVFFVLTGYLWKPDRPLGSDVVSRARGLLIPYVVWLFLVAVVFYAKTHHTNAGAMAKGGSYLFTPFTAFWFVTALFAATVIYRLANPRSDAARASIGLGAIGLAVVGGSHLARLPEGVGIGCAALFFIAVGDLLRVHRRHIGVLRALAVAAAAIVALVLGVSPVNLKIGDFGTPVIGMVVGAALSVAMVSLAEAAEARWQSPRWRVATTFASTGIVVVLAQGVGLYLLADHNDVFRFFVSFVGPVGVAIVAARTPLAPYLVGQPPLKST